MSYKLVFVGDSQTAGLPDGGWTMPHWVEAYLADDPPTSVTNLGAGGATLEGMIAAGASDADPLFDADQTSILVLWGGTNDLSDDTDGAAVGALLAEYCQDRKTAHPEWKIVVLTTLPKGLGLPGSETARIVFNQFTRDNFQDWSDALVDVGGDPIIGIPGAWMNLAYYFTDTIHLNNNGRNTVAFMVQAAIRSLLLGVLPPAPTLTSTPADPSTQHASFSFTDDDPAATFECALDGGAWSACTSPKTCSGLVDGTHTFAVRAINAAGNSSPASFSWNVVVVPPTPSAGTGAALLMV